MPKDIERALLLDDGTYSDYGSRGRKPSSSTTDSVYTPRRVVYCVHGKPSSGCCKVLEGEVVDIDPSDDISQHARESSNTTELVVSQMEIPISAQEAVNKHCHRENTQGTDTKARKKLIIASVLCVIFMIAEVIGGYLSNSLAIASDAAHLLSDFASFMISLFSLYMAKRPSTKKMLFGWYRAEVIGALTSVLMIWVVTGVLVYMAIQRIVHKDYEVDAKIMLITSGIGVVVNIIMGFNLHQHGHTHNKASTHSHEGHNINVRAAFIHVLGDFIQSVGVLVASIVIYFKEDWVIIDPILTFLFSVLVLITTFSIMKDGVLVLMEAIPKGINFEEVMSILLKIEGVQKVHNLRIWSLSMDKIAMSAHVAITPGTNPQVVLMAATKNVHDKFNFFEMTLQIEEFQDVMEDCMQCKNPKE